MDKEDIKERVSKGWIHARFMAEVMANTKENAEKALKEHMAKMKKVKSIAVFNEKFEKAEKVKNPPGKIKEAWSQVVEAEMLADKYSSLIAFVFVFGPSSLEILEPSEIRLTQEEMQNILASIGTYVHRYAAARGIGGLIVAR